MSEAMSVAPENAPKPVERASTKAKKKRKESTKPKMSKQERRTKYTAIARDRRMEKRFLNTTCFHCRKKGHTIQNCPKKKSEDDNTRICFRCGARDHSLADCTNEETTGDTLPFATCFVCKGKGHLASACPENEHGIFVNGGACRICQSTQHRAKTCPQNPNKKTNKKTIKEKEGIVNNEDFSDLLVSETPKHNETKSVSDGKPTRVVKF